MVFPLAHHSVSHVSYDCCEELTTGTERSTPKEVGSSARVAIVRRLDCHSLVPLLVSYHLPYDMYPVVSQRGLGVLITH